MRFTNPIQVFSIASPNIGNADQIRHLLSLGQLKMPSPLPTLSFIFVILSGQFNAFIYFGPSDKAFQMLLEFCPETPKCVKGKLKLKALPKLTHVIFGDEDHKHGFFLGFAVVFSCHFHILPPFSGTYTLSDIFVKGSSEQIAKLPKFEEWNCHKLGAIQFTQVTSLPISLGFFFLFTFSFSFQGSTGAPKAVALTHYQLINGCRIAANAIGIKREASPSNK